MGDASEKIIVAPQSGRAASVPRGSVLRITDVAGHQVGDLWAIDAADHGRWLSVSHTRDRCERLFPAAGEQFRDQDGEPILTLAADTSPGTHDMLFPPAGAGLALPVVHDPVNLFQNSGPRPGGSLAIGVAGSEPGDTISLVAERDVIVVLTACSVDYPPLNNGRCGPLRMEISP